MLQVPSFAYDLCHQLIVISNPHDVEKAQLLIGEAWHFGLV